MTTLDAHEEPTPVSPHNPCDDCERVKHHATLRATFAAWDEGTTPRGRAEGLVYALCVHCRSCLVLPECEACGVVCTDDDRLPLLKRDGSGDVEAWHVRCLTQRMRERGRVKFMVAVGGGKAREFARVAP